jgi:hypothetical protein
MDCIQAAGVILTIWVIMRNIGNERECQLRRIESRIREEAARVAEARGDAPAKPSPDRQPDRSGSK